VSYTYSADGLNRTSVNDNGVPTTYTPNWLNQYTTVGGQALVHNGNFHLYSFNGWTYVYDADARLTSATATGQSTAFVYDGLGRCVKRTINGVVTLITYDGWQPIVEWDSAGNRIAFNIYGAGADEILSRYDVGLDYIHYHSDHMGNVQFLLNRTNVGIEKYTYDVFGKPKITDWNGNVRTQSAYGNRFMFTGREYLSTLGIYDYRTRAYHPGLGRFLQTDPIGFAAGDINLYRYCGNNPVNGTDPFGLAAEPETRKKIKDHNSVVVTGTYPGESKVGPGFGSGSGSGAARSGELPDRAWEGDKPYLEGHRTTQYYDPRIPPANNVAINLRITIGAAPAPRLFPVGLNWNFDPAPNSDSWQAFYEFLKEPATAEQAAYTDTGRVPTLIATGVVFAPVIAPQIIAAGTTAVTATLARAPLVAAILYGTVKIPTETFNPKAAHLVLQETIEWIRWEIMYGPKPPK
jgi:RHS repeat-associated protein